MKGLLIKDYKLMLGQKSFLGMAALMAVLYLIIYKDPIVAVIFITVMCTMFTVSTLSYDEYENGMAYLFTLPISRNTYVLEKYAFALVNCIVTGVIMDPLKSADWQYHKAICIQVWPVPALYQLL